MGAAPYRKGQVLHSVFAAAQLNKNLLSENGPYPAYNGGVSHSGYTDTYNYTENKTIVSQGGASAGFVNFVTSKFYANAHCYVVLPKTEVIDNRYVYHLLRLNQGNLTKKQHGAGIPALRTCEILDIPTPIPCPDDPEKSLAIQTEIVRILDAFSELTAKLKTELTTELTIRKKQYKHYRDQLFSFEGREVKWRTLEEVANFSNGKGHEKNIVGSGKYIVVNSKFISTDGKVCKYSDDQLCPLFMDDILIVMSDLPNGKALSKTFIVDKDEKYTLNQRIGAISAKNKDELLPKFLHYFLNRSPQLVKYDNGIDQTNLRKDQILGVQIPTIPIEEQKRIVAILDKFETRTISISEGLPREIALRQEQYEYYRDLLLSFPKPEEVAA